MVVVFVAVGVSGRPKTVNPRVVQTPALVSSREEGWSRRCYPRVPQRGSEGSSAAPPVVVAACFHKTMLCGQRAVLV